jgi:hypothetical protein
MPPPPPRENPRTACTASNEKDAWVDCIAAQSWTPPWNHRCSALWPRPATNNTTSLKYATPTCQCSRKSFARLFLRPLLGPPNVRNCKYKALKMHDHPSRRCSRGPFARSFAVLRPLPPTGSINLCSYSHKVVEISNPRHQCSREQFEGYVVHPLL